MLSRYLNRWGALPVLLLLFLAVQAPFLRADPHADIAPTSRDAFTDEGLNTSQVVNRVNHGHWVVNECDNLIKTPLFSLWLFPGYSLFGTSILVGHLWVLLGALFLLFHFSRRDDALPWVAGVFVPLGLLQYHLFQYIRFTMGEMTACFLVLVAVGYALRYGKTQRPADGIWAGLFLWAAVFVKNQFGYALLLLPVWAVLVQLVNGRLWERKTVFVLLFSILVLCAGGLLYYLVWYLPTKDTYDYVMADQASGRFIPFSLLKSQAVLQAKEFLANSYVRVYGAFAVVSVILFGINFLTSRHKTYRLLSLLVLVWALAELHKFALWYVPTRYLVSVLFAWGLFASVQVVWAVKNALDYGLFSRLTAGFAVSAAVCLLAVHVHYLQKIYTERQFAIYDTNVKLSHRDYGDRPIMGPWAPTLARETGARVIPVWYGYFNDEDVLARFRPQIIISEEDEDDSGGAFKNHGIRLSELADSSAAVQVGRYRLVIYYLP